MNLDETRVGRIPGRGRGNVFVSKRHYRDRPLPTRGATLGQLRSGLTHVGFVASRFEVQAALPHMLVTNEHFPTAATLRALEPEMQALRIMVIRQKSSWTKEATMRSIFARIGEALAPFLDRFQPIILLDCAKSHLSWRVVATASRNNLWVADVALGT